jgi:hypothetical protein
VLQNRVRALLNHLDESPDSAKTDTYSAQITP